VNDLLMEKVILRIYGISLDFTSWLNLLRINVVCDHR